MKALKPIQLRVAQALANGVNVKTAAAALGLHRSTVHLWLKNEPAFAAAVRAYSAANLETLQRLSDDRARLPVEALRALLSDSSTPAVRTRAAMEVLFPPTPIRRTIEKKFDTFRHDVTP